MKTDAKCQWFALCDNNAVATAPHPILKQVPICRRCADKFDIPTTQKAN